MSYQSSLMLSVITTHIHSPESLALSDDIIADRKVAHFTRGKGKIVIFAICVETICFSHERHEIYSLSSG